MEVENNQDIKHLKRSDPGYNKEYYQRRRLKDPEYYKNYYKQYYREKKAPVRKMERIQKDIGAIIPTLNDEEKLKLFLELSKIMNNKQPVKSNDLKYIENF